METPSSSADPSIASSSPPPTGLGGGMDPSDIYQYQQLSLHSAATTPEMAATGFHPSAGFSVASMGGFANGTTSPGWQPFLPAESAEQLLSWTMIVLTLKWSRWRCASRTCT